MAQAVHDISSVIMMIRNIASIFFLSH